MLCVFDVTDTGIGITKEDMDKIFNQFEQANPEVTKHYGGTGLGLTIVKTLVDAHEGIIEVTSEPEIGSSFRIELRFEKAPGSSVTKIHPAKAIPPQAFKGKVLVVDDDALILRLCSLILKKNEIEHEVYQDSKRILQQNPDPFVTHIFLDIRMPDINGVDLCHSLRRKYPGSTHFIALTAHVLPEEKENLLKDGFDHILTKPFHEHELMNVLGIKAPRIIEDKEQPDLALLREMTMGDESLFQSIVTQFIDETIDDQRLIKEKITQDDAAGLREIVHKMAGRFSQLGIGALAHSLRSLEEQLVDGKKISEISSELNKLIKKVNDMIVHIRLATIEQLN